MIMRSFYIDLDNVLADFHKAASAELGVVVTTEYKISPNEWRRLNPRVYNTLDLMPGATELFEICAETASRIKCNLAILTAIPRPYTLPYATMDKVNWVQKHFPGVSVFIGPYTRDKVYYCKPGDILIDDNALTIREWSALSGIGIHYTGFTPDVYNAITNLK